NDNDVERVTYVEGSQHGNGELPDVGRSMGHVKAHAVLRVLDVLGAPVPELDSRGGDARECCRNQLSYDRTVHAVNDQPRTRHDVDQTQERCLEGFQVGIDVGVIELNVLQQDNT